jgi:hypothetical protein
MVNWTLVLLIPLLPALGALINGVRAFANPHTPKNKLVTNAVALGSTGLAALIAAFTMARRCSTATTPGSPPVWGR